MKFRKKFKQISSIPCFATGHRYRKPTRYSTSCRQSNISSRGKRIKFSQVRIPWKCVVRNREFTARTRRRGVDECFFCIINSRRVYLKMRFGFLGVACTCCAMFSDARRPPPLPPSYFCRAIRNITHDQDSCGTTKTTGAPMSRASRVCYLRCL